LLQAAPMFGVQSTRISSKLSRPDYFWTRTRWKR